MKVKKNKKKHFSVKRWVVLSLILIIVLGFGLFFIFNPFIQRPELQQPVIGHFVINKPTLLKQYTTLDLKPDYKDMKYQPRQFSAGVMADSYTKSTLKVTDPGKYKGWDFLTTLHEEKTLQLDFNRPETVVVVWRGQSPIPSWLSSWRADQPVLINGKSYATYRKLITQSSLKIKTSGASLFLFAEQNGTPSVPPTAPANVTVPKPNQPCPAWVHDEYKARAPNGKLYPTWHPQIDPVYWCYFNHEHGSDPSLFDKNFRIPFGYAGNAMGMHEAHVGYKIYVWDDKRGHIWLALQHQGTATNQAACGTMHELDIAAKDKKTNEIVSEQYFVGDYGISRPIVTTDKIRPTKCPNEPDINPQNVGVRFLPVKDHGAIMGEPWTVNKQNIIGFNFADFTVNTLDSVRMCKDITCDSIVYTGETGTNHTIMYVQNFGPKAGIGHNGIYFTDPMGKQLLSAKNPSAIQQYTKPGRSISSDLPYTSTLEASCRDIYGTSGIMTCGKGLSSVSTARENAIKIPN